jgi:predicted nuclease with TOPRIM domain
MHTDVPELGESEPGYKTPRWVQVWFLKRSRNGWKSKYKVLKTAFKNLQNRVNDLNESRGKWRSDAKELSRRVRKLEAENAILRERAAALKKDGQRTCRSG